MFKNKFNNYLVLMLAIFTKQIATMEPEPEPETRQQASSLERSVLSSILEKEVQHLYLDTFSSHGKTHARLMIRWNFYEKYYIIFYPSSSLVLENMEFGSEDSRGPNKIIEMQQKTEFYNYLFSILNRMPIKDIYADKRLSAAYPLVKEFHVRFPENDLKFSPAILEQMLEVHDRLNRYVDNSSELLFGGTIVPSLGGW